MRKIGLLGGMSWESTLVYYKLINEAVAKELGGLHSAKILLSSVDFAEIAELQARGDWQKSGEHLSEASNYLDDIANRFDDHANDFDLAAEQARDPAMAEYFRGKAARNREEAAIFRARSEAMQREANRASDVANDRSIDR